MSLESSLISLISWWNISSSSRRMPPLPLWVAKSWQGDPKALTIHRRGTFGLVFHSPYNLGYLADFPLGWYLLNVSIYWRLPYLCFGDLPQICCWTAVFSSYRYYPPEYVAFSLYTTVAFSLSAGRMVFLLYLSYFFLLQIFSRNKLFIGRNTTIPYSRRLFLPIEYRIIIQNFKRIIYSHSKSHLKQNMVFH